MTSADPLLTVEEVSAKLRTPAGTLRYWRSIGRGPESFKVGRRVVYATSVVDRYLESQAAATSSALKAS